MARPKVWEDPRNRDNAAAAEVAGILDRLGIAVRSQVEAGHELDTAAALRGAILQWHPRREWLAARAVENGRDDAALKGDTACRGALMADYTGYCVNTCSPRIFCEEPKTPAVGGKRKTPGRRGDRGPI